MENSRENMHTDVKVYGVVFIERCFQFVTSIKQGKI